MARRSESGIGNAAGDASGGGAGPGRIIYPQSRRRGWVRALAIVVSILLALVLLVVAGVYVLSGTDWGRERVRGYAQNMVNGMIHGRATIGRLSGNLLTGITAHDVTITDSAGKPFVAVESFKADYSLIGLLKKHVWLDNVTLERPLVVIDRPPNGRWNYDRIFPRDTTAKPTSTAPSWGDWIRLTDVKVVNAQLIVRSPWAPNDTLHTAARDSVVRDALGGGSRIMVSRVPGGFQKTIQLDSVDASMPLLRLADPAYKTRLLEVSSASMKAYPFHPPGVSVRDLKSVFAFNNDSIWWHGAYVALPDSKASGDGSYEFNSGDMTLAVHTDHADFADMRWVYPRLPDGQGRLDLELAWKGKTQDYQVSNMNLSVGGAHADGSFGITLGDTIAIHGTDVRFAGFDTRTFEQVLPHFRSPRRGVLSGRATVSGGQHAMLVDADVRFDDRAAGPNRITAVGEIGMVGRSGVRAHDLKLGLMPVQVAIARTWDPTLPIAGTVNGSATVNGATNTQLDVAMDLVHIDRGERSAVAGKASVRLAGGKWLNVDLTAKPVSLVELGRFAPAAGLQGSAVGPIHAVGTFADLRVDTDLRLPDGGRLDARGTLDLASKDKGYDLTAQLYTLNLRSIDAKAPATSLTAHAAVKGRGTELATMNAAVAADFSASRLDTIAVDSISVRASVGNGVAKVAKLYAAGAKTRADVSGEFGLMQGRSGELTYVVDVDSLGALNRFIPKQPGAAKPIPPRPRAVARAIRRARADSARIDRATELQRMIAGQRPGPKLVVHAPAPVPADTLSGALHAAGTLRGNIYDFDLRGRAGGNDIVARGNFVAQFQSEYVWTNARTPQAKLSVALDADSLTAMGFAFDTLKTRVTYASTGGHVELAIKQGDKREYAANGDYVLDTDQRHLSLASLTLQFDTASWHIVRPASIEWGGPGIRVTDFELVNRGNGRVYANGLLPTSGMADFRVDIDNFPVSNVADIVQTDIDADGIFTLHGTMSGTVSNPAFRGAYGLVRGMYNQTPVPNLRGTFAYADEQLAAHAEAVRDNGLSMATVDARLPINLAMSGVTGDRLLPRSMSVDLVADSLPLDLVPQFTDMVSQVHGRAVGKVSMRGTIRRPVLVGALTLDHGEAVLNTTGAKLESIGATVRMANDTVYVDSVVAWAKGPLRVRGTIAVGDWREPTLALYLVSSGAQLMNNHQAELRLDAGLALTGPFTRPYLSGAATLVQGVVYAPEPTGRHLIGAGDPALFNVLDTTTDADRDLFPASSPFMQNLRVEVAISIHRDVWVRNREANVEIYTDDPLTVEEEQQAFQLTGVVATDRGEYTFLGKRFQIKRGSAMFIGTPDLNPTLQITGEYQVQAAGRGSLNINVLIGGTLSKPKLSLASDAQPPKTQSELLSLLAFGQSSTSLSTTSSSSSSSIAGSAATMDLFGVGAQMAVKRLASTALGVIVDQVQVQASRGLGTDYFNITPADVPITGASTAGFRQFVQDTRVEAGKYINSRTFVSVQEQAYLPGATIEHRTANGWQFSASFAPRLLLGVPTLDLAQQQVQTKTSLGGFILREWRF